MNSIHGLIRISLMNRQLCTVPALVHFAPWDVPFFAKAGEGRCLLLNCPHLINGCNTRVIIKVTPEERGPRLQVMVMRNMGQMLQPGDPAWTWQIELTPPP